jgi:outer membrane lipoprotein carrier protein
MRFCEDSPFVRRLVAWILGGLAAILIVVRPARGQSAQEVLDQVRQRYESITDAEIQFASRIKFSLAKTEQRVSGTVQFKKEHKYRVELQDRTIVTDGTTVWSYSPQEQQVLIDAYTPDERSTLPEQILTGAPKDFAATIVGHEKSGNRDLVVLKLTPKSKTSSLKSMKLSIDDETWLIRKVELVDLNGTETTYTVQEIRVNPGIPDARFVFTAPEGTTVVDLR